MPKTLIIAEKPSVATDLARVLGKLPELGKFQKKKDFFENEHAYVSSAVGHLVELKMPEGPNGKKLPWGMKHLPIIPPRFELQPIERSMPRYKVLLKLLKKKEVETVVNACDAGREGELIFRYLLQLANLGKPLTVRRMWMQSMTDDAIIEAWNEMRSDQEMAPLADAALCRSESDWLIGLNGTRALTAFNSRNGGFNVTTAGRVQTPTLCILAERERIIRAFVPRPYWEVHGEFSVKQGEYRGRWFREDFEKDEEDNQLKAERIWSVEEAEEIRQRCLGQVGTVEEQKKPSKQAPPLLFDLTSLQREAGNKHGFSASRTLQLAQACYDRYKLLTYPRTDSKCLPEDYLATVVKTVKNLAKAKPNDSIPAALATCANWIIDNDRITPSKRIFDNKKVSDHFAIIPTGKTPPAKLDEPAAKIYALVVRRFLAIFYPHAEFEVTRRITRVGQDCFRTDGRVLVNPGYLEVYGRTAGAPADKDELVSVTDGEEAKTVEVELKADETRPPARYNDSTLLSAMETAGRRVDDEELRDAMSERGLGTPATRASIIENLIRQKYLFRDDRNKRDLVVSNKGLAMTDLLHDIGISTLGSPEMTGEWEYKLKQMETGQLDRQTFMNEIKSLTKSLVEQTRDYTDAIVNRPFPDLLAPCPECGGNVHKQTDGVFECYNPECKFRLKKHIASHELTEDEARTLMTEGRVGPIETFKNRFGQPFTAELTIAKKKRTWKVEFIFEGDDLREEELKSLNDDKLLCEAPVGDGTDGTLKVYETERAFLAPQMATKVDERGVRISKTILQKEIPSEQAKKLFTEGKTDLMPGFISKKNRRFSAHLTLDPTTGKLGFEFAARKTAKKKAGKSDSGEPDKEDDTQVVKKKTVKKKTKATKKKAAKKKKKTKKKAAKKSTGKKSPE
ncbi:MAG: DNA topoisomerase III [Mariniblastus sp.]|nr:DNA topoisomerase III [Mariniblastus sp.]